MGKYWITLVYETGAEALRDEINAKDSADAQRKTQRLADDWIVRDAQHRKVYVGTITRLTS